MKPTSETLRRIRWWWLFGASALLAACGGGGSGSDDGGPTPTGAGFDLIIDSASIAVMQDSNGLLHVGIERQDGFAGVIELTVANPPDGVHADAVIVESADVEAFMPLHFDAGLSLGTLDVVVSGSSGASTATADLHLDVQVAQPTSQVLIQAALDTGQIDLGTSLLYRAYAVFGDERLPEAFIGSGPAEEDIALFTDIEDARPNLPQSILDQLQPYLVRPDDPTSVFNVGQSTAVVAVGRNRTIGVVEAADRCAGGTREWITERSTRHPVRAWALCLGTHASDEKARNNLFRVIDVVDKAYGKMTEDMGPAKPDLWGDEAIDVYVVPNGVERAPRPGASEEHPYVVGVNRGVAFPQPLFAGPTSSGFVIMPNWRLDLVDYQLTLIHELFHILQFAHNYNVTDHWFGEASATWSSFHYNRTAPIRPTGNKGLHEERFGGYQGSGHSLLSVAGSHPYYSYIWPLFMEQEGGGGAKITGAWFDLETVTSDEQATNVIDAKLPFKDNFRKFAVRNWNESLQPGDPIAKRYKSLDNPFPGAGTYLPTVTQRDLVSNRALSLPVEMEALTAKYFRFEVSEDSGIQSVEFDFTGIAGREHLDVDALIRNADGWINKPVPLEGEEKPLFCFDLGPSTETVRGSFVELRLVLSNHGHLESNRISGNLQVHPSRGGCAGWTGEIRWSNLTDVPGVQRNDVSTLASVTFKVDEDPPVGSTPGVVLYKVSRGHVSYRAELSLPTCYQLATAEVEMNPDATSGPGATVASLATFSTNSVPQYGSHSGATFGDITVTGNCTPDGSLTTEVHENQLIPWWSDPSGKPAYDLKDNGTLMQEDVSVSGDQGGVRSQWTLRKIDR